MYKKKKDKKKKRSFNPKAYARAFSVPRPVSGGRIYGDVASMRDPLVKELKQLLNGKHPDKKIQRFVSNLLAKAARGSSATAGRLLKKLGADVELTIEGTNYKVTLNPTMGAVAPDSGETVTETNEGIKRISGANGLYTAKEHQIRMVSGNTNRSWIKNCIKNNGINDKIISDSVTEVGLTNPARSRQIWTFGLNQKHQFAPETELFGFSYKDLQAPLGLTSFATSITREQIPYAAVYELRSQMTITSLNKYVPTYVRISFVNLKDKSKTFPLVFNDCCNNNIGSNTQTSGAMPVFYQQESDYAPAGIGRMVTVDPNTPGVKSSWNWKAAVDIIKTKTVKLSAGDRLKIDYKHLCGSGVRLDKLEGEFDTGTDIDFPMTYTMLIETWGEEVDAYSTDSPENVIKATAPGVMQLEYKRSYKSCPPSSSISIATNTGANKGYTNSRIAIKVFNKSDVIDGVRRYFGTYNNLNNFVGTEGYVVPVMSEASEQDAGRIG